MRTQGKTDFDKGYKIDISAVPVPIQTHGCVYSIGCPITNETIYIGQTVDFQNRLYNHLGVKNKKTKISKYISHLKGLGMRPIFNVVELIEVDSLLYWEEFYISTFKSWGFKLLNH